MARASRTAEVVIVGGGVMGASLAYHLAARGCRDVLVLERAPRLGEGSTGRATGGFRSQFSTAINIQLALLSREKIRRFADEIGADPGYRPCGYLFLAATPEQLAVLRNVRSFQQANGLPEVREVDRDEAQRLNPAANLERVAGGSFCPTDGFLRPLQILSGYARAAERLGVRFEFGAEVSGFELAGPEGDRRVEAVVTPDGPIACRHAVNAAGAWASRLAALAGIGLPVRPLRRQIATTVPTQALPADMPLTIFLEDGFHFRERDGRVLLLWPDEPHGVDPFSTEVDPAWLPEVVRRAHAHVPVLRDIPLDRESCWAGLYEMSPDGHAIVGPAPGLANLYLMNGSSGHGVMHSPALGHLVAEQILDGRAHTIDLQSLRPGRFAEGEAIADVHLL